MEKDEIKKLGEELSHKYGIEDPCPSFGVGYLESDKCCAHCWEDCESYHIACKELTLNKKVGNVVAAKIREKVTKMKNIIKIKTNKKEKKKMVKVKKSEKKKKIVEMPEKKITIKSFVVDNLDKWKNLTNEQIAEKVKIEFNSKTSAACIAWYKNKLAKENG